MDMQSGVEELALQENRPVRLGKAQGRKLVCTAGTIWITVSGKPEDSFLTPGQIHWIDHAGLTIVESIGNGRIRLESTRQPLLADRLLAGINRLLCRWTA